jgi:hypothetical protein
LLLLGYQANVFYHIADGNVNLLSYSLVGRNWGTFLPEMSPLSGVGYKDEFTI